MLTCTCAVNTLTADALVASCALDDALCVGSNDDATSSYWRNSATSEVATSSEDPRSVHN